MVCAGLLGIRYLMTFHSAAGSRCYYGHRQAELQSCSWQLQPQPRKTECVGLMRVANLQ